MCSREERKKVLGRERALRFRETRRARRQGVNDDDEFFSDTELLNRAQESEDIGDREFDGASEMWGGDHDVNSEIQDCSMASVYSASSPITHEHSGDQCDHDNDSSSSESSFDQEIIVSEGEVTGDEDDLQPASITEEEGEELQDRMLDFHDEEEELRAWSCTGNPLISHTRLDKLLKILRRRLLPGLPKSAKTFLQTTKAKYAIEKWDDNGNEFVYFGMREQLRKILNPRLHPDKIIYLFINADGMQLFRSSRRQFWPILCLIYSEEDAYKPFPVAIHSGNHKPSEVEKYLKDFVEELNQLYRDGLMVDGQKYAVVVKAFICDRPARAFLKCIKNHGAYWACERCTVRGERVERRTIYPIDGTVDERTDDSFRNQTNAEHHTGFSPLLDITPPINLVVSFVIDFMHLLCLGVMKKLLMYWLKSRLSVRLSYTSKAVLSQFLIQMQHQIPCDFQRTTRTLADISYFKATEFKFILLYAGPIIFRKVLPKNVFKHFLLLHVACRILCSKTKALTECQNAKSLLQKFVALMPRFYGKASLVGNVHNLIHLADDVYHMGLPLSSITAFPFENALGKIKHLLRSGNRPLAQICRRLHEMFFLSSQRAIPEPKVQILRQLLPDRMRKIVIKRIKIEGTILTTKTPDNTVLLKDGTLLEIESIYTNSDRGEIFISGTRLIKKRPLFYFPCDSGELNMWVVAREAPIGPFNLTQISKKMVTLSIVHERKRRMYTMPLLHM